MNSSSACSTWLAGQWPPSVEAQGGSWDLGSAWWTWHLTVSSETHEPGSWATDSLWCLPIKSEGINSLTWHLCVERNNSLQRKKNEEESIFQLHIVPFPSLRILIVQHQLFREHGPCSALYSLVRAWSSLALTCISFRITINKTGSLPKEAFSCKKHANLSDRWQ